MLEILKREKQNIGVVFGFGVDPVGKSRNRNGLCIGNSPKSTDETTRNLG